MIIVSLPTWKNPPPDPVSGDGKPDREQKPGRAQILIVEDEWLVSGEIEIAVESADHEVAGMVDTADDAVRAAAELRPTLVLMDIRLRGERDGVDAAREIYESLGIRCLFVSAHADDVTRERARAANPVGWLSKPFSHGQLVAALESALRDLRH